MNRDVRPYRWDLLPKIDRRQHSLFEALAAQWPHASDPADPPVALAPLTATPGPVRAYDEAMLRERLADPTAFALRLRREDGAVAYAVVPGPVAIECAATVLRVARKTRLAAPRAATRAEQGVCAFVAAALLERYGIESVAVEPWYEPPPTLPGRLAAGWSLGIEIRVEAARARGTVLVVVAEAVAVAPPLTRALERSFARGAHWLDGVRVTAPIVSGAGRVALRDVLNLARRDVLLLDRPPRSEVGRLAVGRGGFPVTIDDAGVTIAGAYERGTMMDEAVAEDVTVEVACQLGAVQMSARQVLELAPGQVLSLDRALGGPVDLVVGTRPIGRGEIVDVDGELGVRVLSLSEK
jgi:type III secretion system YscQ/HrcQ family protein